MLKGMGACIALPFLDAMTIPGVSNAAVPGKSPIRTAFLFMPNGVHADHWTPAATGSNFELTRQLLPLESLKKDIVVLGGAHEQELNLQRCRRPLCQVGKLAHQYAYQTDDR